jgi:ATP-dependent exoDNAse (exonuclease V) alpha subunit
MADGGRVTLMRNDRKLGVQNGTLGTVGHIDAGYMLVRLDGVKPRNRVFAFAAYAHIDHRYAATVHWVQGRTVERV